MALGNNELQEILERLMKEGVNFEDLGAPEVLKQISDETGASEKSLRMRVGRVKKTMTDGFSRKKPTPTNSLVKSMDEMVEEQKKKVMSEEGTKQEKKEEKKEEPLRVTLLRDVGGDEELVVERVVKGRVFVKFYEPLERTIRLHGKDIEVDLNELKKMDQNSTHPILKETVSTLVMLAELAG